MSKFCSARVNPKCAQHAIDERNIKRLFIKEEIFIVKNSKHTCVLKAIFPQEKKQKFCCCCWICCEDSKYVVLKIRQSSSSWRIGFLSVLASRSYHAARSTPCTSPRRGWAGFPGFQWPRKKRIWLAGSLSWSGRPALYHWSASARSSLLSLRPSTPSSPLRHPPSQDYKPLEVWALHLWTCLNLLGGLRQQLQVRHPFNLVVVHLLLQKGYNVLLCPGLPCNCCCFCCWLSKQLFWHIGVCIKLSLFFEESENEWYCNIISIVCSKAEKWIYRLGDLNLKTINDLYIIGRFCVSVCHISAY